MHEKIHMPINLDDSDDLTFDNLIETIQSELEKRLCQNFSQMILKTIAQLVQVSNSTFMVVFVDKAIAIIDVAIVNQSPVLRFMTAKEVLSFHSLRESVLEDDLLSRFLVVKKTREEKEMAAIKAATLAKLSPEEIAALGLASN